MSTNLIYYIKFIDEIKLGQIPVILLTYQRDGSTIDIFTVTC